MERRNKAAQSVLPWSTSWGESRHRSMETLWFPLLMLVVLTQPGSSHRAHVSLKWCRDLIRSPLNDPELRVNNFYLLRRLFPGLTVGSLCPGFSLVFHLHFTVSAEVQLMHPGTQSCGCWVLHWFPRDSWIVWDNFCSRQPWFPKNDFETAQVLHSVSW